MELLLPYQLDILVHYHGNLYNTFIQVWLLFNLSHTTPVPLIGACMHAHTYTTETYTYTHAHTHIHTQTSMYTHIHAHTHTHTYTHAHAHTHVPFIESQWNSSADLGRSVLVSTPASELVDLNSKPLLQKIAKYQVIRSLQFDHCNTHFSCCSVPIKISFTPIDGVSVTTSLSIIPRYIAIAQYVMRTKPWFSISINPPLLGSLRCGKFSDVVRYVQCYIH